ncbi:uncharacterized protein ASPGLDRAFT_50784 [Aspergillus glaucus CBS 516.65]|uniref:GS catalytic domain-containing protein n=1 Tax=Aspergillus glaucus CBS 516.65 TaxID=1160497 RepID=A0A1L9VBH4_ASPGL|nr:hypothetical protein ASPGLDRAFT_50784 [Aspergillus glaucus CBS 516.65]OJJ81250.1 hypothetical protein ASPGLDRAFT_50784 [Aspergillus glaucus CBS 516.65]
MKLPQTHPHSPIPSEKTTPLNHNETAIRNLQLKNPSLRFIRFQWQDYSGALRGRILPIHHCLRLAKENKPIEVPPTAFECIFDNMPLPDLNPTGTDSLLPDWGSARTSSQSVVSEESYATVMCEVMRSKPASPVSELDLCPRRALAKVVHKAIEVCGLSFLVGFEVEFGVMKVSADWSDIIPHSTGSGRFAIGQRDPCFAHVEECICELQYAGIDIESFQTQGRHQYQLSLHPRPPLQAVDELILVHDRIKRVFAKHGYIATMCPKPVASRQQTTSQHMHISISPPYAESSFLAGILKRLQALCAFSLPYDLCYEREQPYPNSEVVAWGTQNWEVPIRKIKPGHWDFRCVDATANMYLTLAAFLGVGILGIQNEEPLVWPDTGIPGRLDPAAYLPSSLEDALCFLEVEADEIEEIMESKIVDRYIELKRVESSRMRKNLGEARRLHIEVF